MKYLKLVLYSVLAIMYSNFVWAKSCDELDDKVLDALAKAIDVRVDEIAVDKTFYAQNFDTDVLDLISAVVDMEEAIGVELKDEDVVDPVVYFDEEEFEPKIKDQVTVREFQETVHKVCVNSLR